MIESKNEVEGLDTDNMELNTAEALGFTISSSITENPYIIPDDEDYFTALKKLRPVASA